MKYRKKPVTVEAFKWTGGPDQLEDPCWIIEAIKKGTVTFENSGTENVCLIIETLEGNHKANRGDFIIKGVKGELYPCKPDIFEMTYEPSESLIIENDNLRIENQKLKEQIERMKNCQNCKHDCICIMPVGNPCEKWEMKE